ncbi:hypothetical protein [Spirosoma utsteinense]|uniref:DNA glycosylase n=1 Tax=Spirosoma utsteinense TaxID=2585773 RepID=A0ABR6WFH8_9BACT|nr:hypothetical protein [Spirosoma utsteinense]MBC3789396.1 hypothetical protein [Spirosoma utsteinense]MBC3795300.1 hypothetical protein [Spirosoma utsteinense]
MACPHKFQEYLTLEQLDFEPTTLIVGTFNPAWPAGNYAQWFYGRTNNNYFWDVLPRLYQADLNLRPGTVASWKQFCADKKIALTDMISSINDADQGVQLHNDKLANYTDAALATTFADFTFTDIVKLLRQHPTIKYVYLTRKPGISLFDDQWMLVENYGIEHGLHVRNLLTPSKYAFY